MKVLQIDPTPNPDAMKITVDFDKEGSRSSTYDRVSDDNPAFINEILNLDGVRSVFHAMNFITVDKKADADWDGLLEEVETVINNQV